MKMSPRSRYALVLLGLVVLFLAGAVLLYRAPSTSVPAPTKSTDSLVFVRPSAGEVLVQGESYRIRWQGTHPNTLSLRLVPTEDASGHGVIISKHIESLEEENEQPWDIACGAFTAPGSYRFVFEDEATGEYIFPSAEFSIEEGSSCGNPL